MQISVVRMWMYVYLCVWV